MEPFEAIVKLLKEEKEREKKEGEDNSTVGGAPQIIKVYQHMNARVIGVLWPREELSPTVLGRKILGYENTDLIFIHPESKKNVITPYTLNSQDSNGYVEKLLKIQELVDLLKIIN